MENPWADLPETPPFVAPADGSLIGRYPKAAARLQLDLLPTPYLGKPDAQVYVLVLNPGGQHDDFEFGAEFVRERRRALRFESSCCFWSLNPALRGSEAHKYAWDHMGRLIGEVGRQRVAERMMWVQYFGYQSLRGPEFPVELPSQRFGFQLVQDAIVAGKLVIIARSRMEWTEAVPELASYDYIRLSNWRRPYLTPGNMGGAAFARLVQALSE
jgi:hypothetical protein